MTKSAGKRLRKQLPNVRQAELDHRRPPVPFPEDAEGCFNHLFGNLNRPVTLVWCSFIWTLCHVYNVQQALPVPQRLHHVRREQAERVVAGAHDNDPVAGPRLSDKVRGGGGAVGDVAGVTA